MRRVVGRKVKHGALLLVITLITAASYVGFIPQSQAAWGDSVGWCAHQHWTGSGYYTHWNRC